MARRIFAHHRPRNSVAGTTDHVVPKNVAFDLADRIPTCRLVRVEGAGHFWVLGRIKKVLTEIAAGIRATAG